MDRRGRKLTKHQRYYQTPKGRAQKLVDAARQRGQEVTITPQWVQERIEEGACPRTGIPFVLKQHDTRRCHPHAPSLDCIDPKKGYTPDNVQVVVHQYNTLKAEGTDDEALAFAMALTHHQTGGALCGPKS